MPATIIINRRSDFIYDIILQPLMLRRSKLCYNMLMVKPPVDEVQLIEYHATSIRRQIIQMLALAGSGHPASSLGLVEVLACLYFNVLRYNPADPNDDQRDLLVMSNGHACPALYATLAEAGLIDPLELRHLRQYGSRLQGHPERTRLPWLETTSGPLGEGLSQAAGMAYSLRHLDSPNDRRVYCIVSDGELDEGNIWEAVMFAGKYRLANLVAIVDCNDIQLSGRVDQIMPLGDLAQRWRAAGWRVSQITDGNDVTELLTALGNIQGARRAGKPLALLTHTCPGKGVSFMEHDYHWHGRPLSEAEAGRALAELGVR